MMRLAMVVTSARSVPRTSRLIVSSCAGCIENSLRPKPNNNRVALGSPAISPHTEEIVGEILRVGRQGIVTFPNFGHWSQRLQIFFAGRMPVSDVLPYQWYNTPNLHLFTIADFENFCGAHSIRILERLALHRDQPVKFMPNLRGTLAVFRFENGAAT